MVPRQNDFVPFESRRAAFAKTASRGHFPQVVPLPFQRAIHGVAVEAARTERGVNVLSVGTRRCGGEGVGGMSRLVRCGFDRGLLPKHVAPLAIDTDNDGVGDSDQLTPTLTRTNRAEIPRIQQLAVELGAVAHHIFLLVPTGRGKYIIDQEITAEEYEQTLNWFYDQRDKTPLQLKATCAPHYYRILRQRARSEGKTVTPKTHGLDAMTRGCLGGVGFCFISHRGIVQPCGFLNVEAGDVTRASFADIWNHSETFQSLRRYDDLKGKCGLCEYKKFCGGCRARAFEATGDILAQEPLCSYQPARC